MKEFHLQVVTPDGLEYDGMVESLLVPSSEGYVEFLAGHIDYLATIGTGKARIKVAGKDRLASVSGGFVTVVDGGARLVAITFEFAENIDLERAKRAESKAKEIISTSKDSKTVELAKLKLQRAAARIHVANLK